jgi:hypothetical protein
MKRLILTAAIAGVLAAGGVARAHDAYDDSESYPLRLAAYALHPVGWTLEWLFMRPLHFFVSQPGMEPIFGHVPHESPFGDYRPYKHDDAD